MPSLKTWCCLLFHYSLHSIIAALVVRKLFQLQAQRDIMERESMTDDPIFPYKLSNNSEDATCQNTGELSYLARYAINGTSNASCKRDIRGFACIVKHLEASNAQSTTVVPHRCKLDEFEHSGEYAGCFRSDSKLQPLLQRGASSRSFHGTITPDVCIDYCYRLHYEYAAVQFATCYCGARDDIAKAERMAENKCLEFACPGNLSLGCGGETAALAYRTGVQPMLLQNQFQFVCPSTILPKQGQKPVNRLAKVAFIIFLNGRAVRQVKRMLNLIYSPVHFYYIHVDSKSEHLHEALLSLEQQVPNVRLKRNRFTINTAGSSSLHAYIDAVRDLFETFHEWKWDFVTNLNGGHFPLLPTEEMAAFLGQHLEQNFLEFNSFYANRAIQGSALEDRYVECDGRLFTVGYGPLPKRLRVAGGEEFFTLNRGFLEFLVNSNDQLTRVVLKHFNHTLTPLTFAIHTILANSKFCHTIASRNLQLLNSQLTGERDCMCRYDNTEWCGCTPDTFQQFHYDPLLMAKKSKSTDKRLLQFLIRNRYKWNWVKIPEQILVLLANDEIAGYAIVSILDIAEQVVEIMKVYFCVSANKELNYFGNKFDPIVNQKVIEMVEAAILNNYQSHAKFYKHIYEIGSNRVTAEDVDQRPGFNAYWESLYHSRDKDARHQDILMTLMQSLARISLRNLTSVLCSTVARHSVCCQEQQRSQKPLEFHVARYDDQKTRLLVTFRVTCNRMTASKSFAYLPMDGITIEAQFGRAGRPSITDPTGRLSDIQVGTQFDRSDLFFRNYAGAVAVGEVPTLLHEWNEAESDSGMDVLVRWIDPYGNVRGVGRQTIEPAAASITTAFEENYKKFEKPDCYSTLPPSLTPPGIWKAQIHLVENPLNESATRLLGETEFAVLPRQPDKLRKVPQLTIWNLVEDPECSMQRRRRSRIHCTNEFATNVAIDCMVERFYKLTGACFVGSLTPESTPGTLPPHKTRTKRQPKCPRTNVVLRQGLTECSIVTWSSRSPDPKSEFTPFFKADIIWGTFR